MIRIRRFFLRVAVRLARFETDLARDRLRCCGRDLIGRQDRERELNVRLARVNAQADAGWRARQC